MDEFQRTVLEQLKAIGGRLDGMDKRFDGIDNRLDGIDNRLDGIDNRLDRLESKQGAMEQRLAENTRELDRLTNYVNSGFDTVLKMIDSLDERKVERKAI